MSDEQQRNIWEKQDGESSVWYRRFSRYLLMFPKRSVAAVYNEENNEPDHGEENREKPRKSEPPGHWYEMAKQWKWEERAEAWDAAQFAEEEKIKKRVIQTKWALQHRRILALQEVAQSLLDMMGDENKVWVPDVKSIGSGPDAERVDLVQFNSDLYKEFREYISDIAEEVGGRVKKQETTHKGLSKMYVDLDDDEDGCEP